MCILNCIEDIKLYTHCVYICTHSMLGYFCHLRSLLSWFCSHSSITCFPPQKPYLDVFFKPGVVGAGESTHVDIAFHPREPIKCHDTLWFEINGVSRIPVVIKGQGAEMKVRVCIHMYLSILMYMHSGVYLVCMCYRPRVHVAVCTYVCILLLYICNTVNVRTYVHACMFYPRMHWI